VRANRCLTLLSKMFNLSTLWKLRADNPVKASDDASKKPVVMSLVAKLGFEPVDAGPLRIARLPGQRQPMN
jgi:predicted dinucleotide-binding enzyme